jgi:hypothetical protein
MATVSITAERITVDNPFSDDSSSVVRLSQFRIPLFVDRPAAGVVFRVVWLSSRSVLAAGACDWAVNGIQFTEQGEG